MAFTPTDPTKAEVRTVQNGGQLEFDFYIPRGAKGEPGGITLGTHIGATTDWNSYTTDGVYRAIDASGLNRPPLPGGATAYGTFIISATESGTRLTQTFYPSTGALAGRAIYQRGLAGGVWSAWRTLASTRVDQTAGRAIYQWDDVNSREQLIYGDTGWRNVAADQSWIDALSNTGITVVAIGVRRLGYQVFLRYGYTKTTAGSITFVGGIPLGFRVNAQSINAQALGADSALAITRLILASGANPGLMQGPTSSNAMAYLVYDTTDPWPTTLPGTASGGIPNL